MTHIIGLVLAGGRGRRLGGAGKAGHVLGGHTLLEWTAARLGPQCELLLVSLAPDMPEPAIDATVVRDATGTYEGPLAGLLAGMDWITEHTTHVTHVVTAPVDSPFLPLDLCERLKAAMRAPGDIAFARSSGQDNVLHAMWPLHLRSDLRAFLETGQTRKVRDFQDRHTLRSAGWDNANADAFFNINTEEELEQARAMLARNLPAMKKATTLDLCGLKCPLPVLKTRKALAAMRPGERLNVTCTDPLAAIDIPFFVQKSGDTLYSQVTRPDGLLTFTIIKKG